MIIDTQYNIGDEIFVDGKKETVKSIHIYITQDEKIKKERLYLGDNKWYTAERIMEDINNGRFIF